MQELVSTRGHTARIYLFTDLLQQLPLAFKAVLLPAGKVHLFTRKNISLSTSHDTGAIELYQGAMSLIRVEVKDMQELRIEVTSAVTVRPSKGLACG